MGVLRVDTKPATRRRDWPSIALDAPRVGGGTPIRDAFRAGFKTLEGLWAV
ncbi:hypothetical protein NJ7G_2089 [Natrinema sp. J7-2]|nr:hypothetical protein NJ7G_2089 [Natrinema sp. J7-2]